MPGSLISAIVSKMSATSSGAMPERGLVEQQQLRARISARPMASICCSPPESVPAVLLQRSCSRGNNA